MKSTPPPRPTPPPPDDDQRSLTPLERMEILDLLRRTAPRKPLPKAEAFFWRPYDPPSDRLAIRIEERLSALVWELMDDQGKAPRFSKRYYAQRERLRETLLDERSTPSEHYDKALQNLHALLDTLNDPDDRAWNQAFPHPLSL